jgi:hypothetical protein
MKSILNAPCGILDALVLILDDATLVSVSATSKWIRERMTGEINKRRDRRVYLNAIKNGIKYSQMNVIYEEYISVIHDQVNREIFLRSSRFYTFLQLISVGDIVVVFGVGISQDGPRRVRQINYGHSFECDGNDYGEPFLGISNLVMYAPFRVLVPPRTDTVLA